MSTPSEDNQIDQSLRDIFRDYDLPPDAHPRVWEGVAGRIANLPAPSKGLPYRFLLPLTAAVGIGLGWLLPHPGEQQSPKATAPATQVQYTVIAPAPEPMLPATAAAGAPQPVPQPAVPVQQATRKQWVSTSARSTAGSRAVSSAMALDSANAITVQAAVTPELVVQTASAPPAVVALAPVAAPQATVAPQKYASKASKPTGSSEKIGYRKLTQRQPESRRGIGRWVTRFFQGVRHILG